MRSNVKTIKLTAWLSLFLSTVTYAISVKEKFGVNELKWLPDTFLIAVFGGAFASMLVVLICEISKYYENRLNTETFLFSHLYYLYGQLQAIQKNIVFFTNHENQIYEGALTQLISNSVAEMNTIYYTDYAPFKKGNSILAEKANYNREVFPIVQTFLQDCQMLRMAFLTDKISVIEKEMGKREETGNNTSLVLAKLIKQIQAPLSLLDKMLTKIDQLCNGRYNWLQVRDNMIKGIPDNRTDMLEQFLARK